MSDLEKILEDLSLSEKLEKYIKGEVPEEEFEKEYFPDIYKLRKNCKE